MERKIEAMLYRVDKKLVKEGLGAIGVCAKQILASEIAKLVGCKECGLRERANKYLYGRSK